MRLYAARDGAAGAADADGVRCSAASTDRKDTGHWRGGVSEETDGKPGGVGGMQGGLKMNIERISARCCCVTRIDFKSVLSECMRWLR